MGSMFAGTTRGASTWEPTAAASPPPPRLARGSPQQEAIWSAICEGESHLVVEARAGTGKSSTCREAMHRLIGADRSLSGRLSYCAFNRSIADEFQAGLPPGARATTMHSAGFAALRAAFPGLGDPDRHKLRGIADRLLGGRDRESRKTKTCAVRLAEACKGQLLGRDARTQRYGLEPGVMARLASGLGLDVRGREKVLATMVPEMLDRALRQTASVDFGDMVWMPVMLGLEFPAVEVLFVDECLPSWTPVLLADGSSKTIGEIVDAKLAVEVLAYDTEAGTQRACKVTGWSRTINRKPLVKIRARWNRKKGTSQPTNFIVCTADHKVWADGRWIEAGEVRPGMTVQVETSASKSQRGKITSPGRRALAGMVSSRNAGGLMGTPPRREQGPPVRGGNGTGASLAEGLLYSALGPGWVMQHVIPTGRASEGYPKHYKLDIANLDLKIAVEVDGQSHRSWERKEADRRKDEFLRSVGWKVIRVPNREAIQRTDEAAAMIMASDCPIGATVTSVEPVEIPDSYVYDISVEGCHNFYANGILVHNCQDLDPCQHALVRLMAGDGRMVCVGDPCQPTGTLVDVVVKPGDRWSEAIIEKRPIECLKEGDILVSMSPRDRQWNRSRSVLGISHREYYGDLVTIKTACGLSSRYTPNHHCIASFGPLREKFCVYLMRKGDQFRIGKAKMDYGQSCGLRARMTAEGADSAWILSLHDTDQSAFIQEQVLSANFGLPQLTFKPGNKSVFLTQEQLDGAWSRIECNEDRAVLCLKFFGRDISYPLLTASSRAWLDSLKRPMVVHASNLMTGCLVLPYRHGSEHLSSKEGPRKRHIKRGDWSPIVVGRQPYRGLVWSMTVDQDQSYVGDGILTHNCQAIYAFRGADSRSMATLAEQLRSTPRGLERLPLTATRRCPASHVKLARNIVPDFESLPGAPGGRWEEDAEIGDVVVPGWMVLCRKNAPLLSAAFAMAARGVPVAVQGRDLGEGLARFVEDFEAAGVAELLRQLADYRAAQMERLSELDDAGEEIQQVNDRCDCVRAVADGCRTPADVAGKVRSLFQEVSRAEQSGRVLFSSIHRAKGREADEVAILEPESMPSPFARSEAAIEQEHNLIYVASTRSKHRLSFLGPVPHPLIGA